MSGGEAAGERIISNVVMMGMGEPLANFDNVVTALRVMLDDHAYGLSRRRVTVSTSGIVPAMDRLREVCPVALAVSLHAPNDALRDKLVPINQKYPLKALLAACNRYLEAAPRDFITFEYVMLDGVNDQDSHARELVAIAREVSCKFNLIPFNPFPNSGYQRSSPERIRRFRLSSPRRASSPRPARRGATMWTPHAGNWPAGTGQDAPHRCRASRHPCLRGASMKRQLLCAICVLLLAGCATRGAGLSTESNIQRPVSELPATSERQAGAKIHVDLGTAYFKAGRFGWRSMKRACPGLRSGIRTGLSPLRPDLHVSRRQGRGAAEFRKASALAPGDPEINNTYGWFLCASGEERAGLERLATVVRNPYYRTPTRPFTNAGLCYLRLNEDEAAERQFQLAVQADPSNTLALYQLASLAYKRGAYDIANGHLQTLQQQAVPTAESLLLGTRIARKLGNRENEASFATQLRSRFPTSKEYETYSKEQSR